MRLHVLYDNQMKTNCNSSNEKKSARTGPIRIGCEQTLKSTHVISHKITLITEEGLLMPNSLASIVHHHSNYRQFQNLVMFI